MVGIGMATERSATTQLKDSQPAPEPGGSAWLALEWLRNAVQPPGPSRLTISGTASTTVTATTVLELTVRRSSVSSPGRVPSSNSFTSNGSHPARSKCLPSSRCCSELAVPGTVRPAGCPWNWSSLLPSRVDQHVVIEIATERSGTTRLKHSPERERVDQPDQLAPPQPQQRAGGREGRQPRSGGNPCSLLPREEPPAFGRYLPPSRVDRPVGIGTATERSAATRLQDTHQQRWEHHHHREDQQPNQPEAAAERGHLLPSRVDQHVATGMATERGAATRPKHSLSRRPENCGGHRLHA